MDNYGFQPDHVRSGQPFAITRYPTRNGQNDYLVEVNSRGKIFKKPGFYRILSAILLFLALLFLIALIIIIILYMRYKPKICTSNECLRTASNLKLSLDLNVDPCENFYEYSCGKWSEEHPNHGWWSSFSSFTTITERVAISSMNVLTTEKNDTDEPEALKKSRDFYKSCMDADEQNKLGLTPMYQYLRRAKLPVVPSILTLNDAEKSTFTFNWMRTETLIKQIFMMDVFVGALVDSNIFNGSENVLYVGLIYQKCPLPSPLKRKKMITVKDDGESEDEKEKLADAINSNIIKYVLKEMALNFTGAAPEDNRLQEAAEILIKLSDKIQEFVVNYTDPHPDEDEVYSITFKQLQAETDAVLPTPQPDLWITYFNYLFTGTNVTIDPDKDLLFVTDLDVQFLYKILPFVFNTPQLHLELYLWWSAVYAMIANTSSDVVEYILKQMALYGHGTSGNIARTMSLECALLVNNYMGYAVSYALADQIFPNQTKPKVEKMVDELKQAFVDHVNKIQWMDKETKMVTLEKSKEMLTFIGYPDWLMERGKLDTYYSKIKVKPDTFLDNMLNTIMAHNLKKMNSLRQVRKRDWYSEPIEVNAFNSFSDNAINVPMAILSFPMYNLGLEVLNYGSIGAILGHELTHGFDNMGRKHDKYGNHVQWWSNKTIETFENLTKCFIDQYDNFTIEGVEDHVNGKDTLGENLADNGGLNQAFSAYKRYAAKFGDEPKLPGFEDFTDEQMFFLAYGSVWCETTTVQDLKEQIEYDEHCPNAIRVLGTLQNSKEFAAAFKCPVGSFMNPAKKCQIW